MGTVYTKHSDYIIRKDGLFIQYKEPVILNNNVQQKQNKQKVILTYQKYEVTNDEKPSYTSCSWTVFCTHFCARYNIIATMKCYVKYIRRDPT